MKIKLKPVKPLEYEAIEIKSDLKVTAGEEIMEAKSGDWLVIREDGDTKVYTKEEFEAKFDKFNNVTVKEVYAKDYKKEEDPIFNSRIRYFMNF